MNQNNLNQPRRGHPLVMLISTVFALIAASLPVSAPAVADIHHTMTVDNVDYEKANGHWDIVNLPKEYLQNTIHAAALPTGKILLVAGSGNNRQAFDDFHDKGTIKVLKSAVFDPADNSIKTVSTPNDLFCAGHTMLPSGNILVAGGTSGYEVLKGEVKKPAGGILIHNEDPDSPIKVFKQGTRFTSSKGKVYLSTQDVTVKPATKTVDTDGQVTVTHSSAKVFVEAIAADKSYINANSDKYSIEGLVGDDTHNVYGQGDPMTLDKQDYRGDNKTYEFNPITEAYQRVGDMDDSRWYASLPILQDGKVLAVSGLDSIGKIAETTETYDPETRVWTPSVDRQFPTYPALFRTKDPDVLFFSGSNAGYGPANKNREPGFWNIKTNEFQAVEGLRQTDLLETSGSVMLPPAKHSNDGSQSSMIMVAGGGGVGESDRSTNRTDIIDLSAPNPHYVPGPDMPKPLRYPNMTVTPWDDVITNGGTEAYRAKNNSYSYKTFSMNASSKQTLPLADEIVGRSYHSGSLLLRDGRILVFGSDPLYGDKNNTTPGTFEQRLEIYTPPELYQSKAPQLTGPATQTARRGQTLTFTSADAATIRTARLIPPSSTTHVTNLEQRSIGAIVHTNGETVTIDLPQDDTVLMDGWYMLFVTNQHGTPSVAKMIQVL